MSYKKYSTNLTLNVPYSKLLNSLYIKGKKESWINDFHYIMNYFSNNFQISISNFLWQLFKKLHSSVEMRVYKKRGRIFNTPFIIPYTRQIFQVVKWLKIYLKTNKNKLNKKDKIIIMCFSILSFESKYYELLERIEKNGSVIDLKKNNYSLSVKHKMYAHYRW